jgi:hypothetical protein
MQAKQLDKATFGYDFRETSSSSHQSVVKKVKKSDISATFDHQGVQTNIFLLLTPTFPFSAHPLLCSNYEGDERLVLTCLLVAGAYLCIKAYGEANLTFSLRAALSLCPADFTEAGEQLLCQSRLDAAASEQRYSECASDGTCVCKPPYNKPVADVYPCEPHPCPLSSLLRQTPSTLLACYTPSHCHSV